MPLPTQSITDKILARIAANLTTAATGLMTVNRSKQRPNELSELPLAIVRPLKEMVNKIGHSIRVPGVERTLTVGVIVRAEGQDADLDPYRTLVIQSVMGDLSVGGLAIEVNETEHNWENEEATDADYTQDVIAFEVRYQTARTTTVNK
jgi:hypothetical protein